MKTNNESVNAHEIEKQDEQLDEAALDGVVGGARPRDKAPPETSVVLHTCW